MSGNAAIGRRLQIGAGWDWAEATVLGPGDVSGDVRADIMSRDVTGTLRLFQGNGAGSVAASTAVSNAWNVLNVIVAPGNWDRARGNDLLARDCDGRLWLYRATTRAVSVPDARSAPDGTA